LARIAVSSIAAYLLKNFLSPTKVVVDQPSESTILAAKKEEPGGKPHPPTNPIWPKKP